GLLRAQTGSVRVFGVDPVADPVAVLSKIGYLSEDRDLPLWMRVADYVNYTKAFFPNWDDDYARELIDLFELTSTQKLKSLSRGQLARAGLLAALAHRPELLLLDEPSSGLDPVVRRDILSAIIRTVADEGRTVVFSSHLLDEVQRVSDHLAVLHAGRLMISEPLDDVLNSHERLVVRFEQPLESAPRIDGVISCHGEGHEWSIVCNGQRDHVERQISEMNAQIVERGAPSLEEIFVARIGGRSKTDS
ncbi:MAG: ABC transporter ATP-binding protein, partial [Planctomycetota bacterium]|nr:ABC transporter ATP-binding protein [Planctomycetota bacterium]